MQSLTPLSLREALLSNNPVSNRTVTQLCNGRESTRIIGIAVDRTRDLNAVQKMAVDWSKGRCVEQENLVPGMDLSIKVFDLAALPATNVSNSSSVANNRTMTRRTHRHGKSGAVVVKRGGNLHKRVTCSYIQVVSGDGCGSLVSRCGISAADFTKYNPKTNLCSALQIGDYVCCSADNGICATHLIQNGDSCEVLAKQYGVTVADLEKWNKGKTWAWTECKNMAGAECGPLVPGTILSNSTTSMADLNPCPLKACCSNWGFCGIFPEHCTIHAPEGGGPGSKLGGFENTCVSNCGRGIKQNSGPPAVFSRVGYYSAFNFKRDCLWLSAKDANTDGSYTHIHWAFGDIDSTTWKPFINESRTGQWDEFKALKNVKRVISFGGWAASTEAATYNIIRSAIITNRDLFANNLATFAKAEGIDGIDIDWEYPGAPDILVDGAPIGKITDGLEYLNFLTILKQQLGADHSVSIAAPASYWYLKAFPIDHIAAVIDYIVYMTYDLHGQWDAGNANAYDQCDSGRCIRSHINLTETRNALSMITKAGVPNNKILVGEASYGRTFKMATDGCWGPMCDFTGSKFQSQANPGRCTNTSGYLGYAEINELLSRSGGQIFHDGASNSDILLYKGDYVSYMTPTTKDTRRADWKTLNFAGSIDWALDLQAFTTDDMAKPPDRPSEGERGCVLGEDLTVNSGDLCDFSCNLGFCPESLCVCTYTDIVYPLPAENSTTGIIAWDEDDVDLNRLCLFACKYGYCPEEVCTTVPEDDVAGTNDDDPFAVDADAVRQANEEFCSIFKDHSLRDKSTAQCYNVCEPQLEAAKEAGKTSNYGCMGTWALDQPIPWTNPVRSSSDSSPTFMPLFGTSVSPSCTIRVIYGEGRISDKQYAPGRCTCDNWVLNEIADTIIEALPIIAQIGCYILMSTLQLAFELGSEAIPGVLFVLDARKLTPEK
ncbi:glycoside hydrolase family 18 protein [Rutstroemia sp. NJR-2017a BBW]|nr:glycoside hydrolase family 18 protein [Rutstroemia sp. NJR-2017a BBW]